MKVSVKKLKAHPKNQEIYSISNIEDLEKSISSVGLLEKLVIDKDFQVISGNRRLKAIQNLGWDKVDCEKVSIPADEIHSYLIHHNKQRVKSWRELLIKAKVLMKIHKIGQGKTNDILTSVNANRSWTTRDYVAEMIDMSGVNVSKLH